MLRCLPGALDPGAPPEFTSPDDVSSWIRAVDWLVDADRAIILHVDGTGRLTCVATGHSRLHYLGPLSHDAIAADALACDAAAVLAVDVRQKLPPAGPSSVDRRRHRNLRLHLASFAVALLDTVIVCPAGGLSVTGALNYPLGTSLSWLNVHVPCTPEGEPGRWAHEPAAIFPPGSARAPDPLCRPTLWLASDP